MLYGADEKAACPAGRVHNRFADARIDLLDDELSDGPRRVELASITCGLKVSKKLFVDVTKHVAVVGGIKVDSVDLVDDLAHQRAVLHVVVGIIESHANESSDF